MKIKTALTIFTALTLIVFGAMAILLMRTTNLLEAEATSLARASKNIRVSKEIQSHLLTYNRNVFLYSLNKVRSRLEANKVHQTALRDLVRTSEQIVDSKEEAAALSDLKEKLAEYFKAEDQTQKFNLSPVDKYSQTSKKLDAVIDTINKVVEINNLQMRSLVMLISQQNIATDRMVFALLFISSLILLGLVVAIIVTVGVPLATLSKVISQYNSAKNTSPLKIKGLKEIREIADNFNSMTNRLEESRNDQLHFIASIAHDLRNPIGSLSMAAELLIEKGDVEQQSLTQIISRQANHLDRLVGDLLDTTRIEAGQMEIKRSLQDVSCLIRDSVDLYRAGTTLHNFKIDIRSGPLVSKCDSGRLTQVMNNLLSNAVKYSPEGGTVTVEAWAEETQIVISVTDLGIGISNEDLNNIFKPFHRTKATKGSIPGIGLGLSASRRIAELHGGELKVESTLGFGSTFYVSLPTVEKT